MSKLICRGLHLNMCVQNMSPMVVPKKNKRVDVMGINLIHEYIVDTDNMRVCGRERVFEVGSFKCHISPSENSRH